MSNKGRFRSIRELQNSLETRTRPRFKNFEEIREKVDTAAAREKVLRKREFVKKVDKASVGFSRVAKLAGDKKVKRKRDPAGFGGEFGFGGM